MYPLRGFAQPVMATPARLDAALTTAAHYKHAEEPVGDEDALLEQLGGMAHIRTFGSESARLKRMIAPNAPLNQHVIYQALGLRALLDHAEFFKKDFDAFCKSFVASTQSEFALDYVAVPVKTHKSADAKVSVDYKGDCAQLKDAVRGTILLTGEPRPDLIDRAYALIDRLLRSPLIDGKDVRVLHLKDRYQQPSGSYRDWLLLFNIRGHICELQINLEAAQRRKKDGQVDSSARSLTRTHHAHHILQAEAEHVTPRTPHHAPPYEPLPPRARHAMLIATLSPSLPPPSL